MDVSARAGRRYHHGDLPAALRVAALALVAERGPQGFSLAEAARRAGVTVAAPYRHFADRESLLAAIAVQAYDALAEQLCAVPAPAGTAGAVAAAARLSGMAGAYVRFAAEHRAHFQVLFAAGIDKDRHPEVRTSGDRALAVVTDVVAQLPVAVPNLAIDLWALAHGYALLLTDGALADHGLCAGQAAHLAQSAAARLAGRAVGLGPDHRPEAHAET